MPRFVVLTHDHPFLHWDLMLESGDSLRTWRLSAAPDSPERITAEPLPDHRLHYLDYEGPLSNDRGEVRRWDSGQYTMIEDEKTRLRFRLEGRKLQGEAVMEFREPDGSLPGSQHCSLGGSFYFRADSSAIR